MPSPEIPQQEHPLEKYFSKISKYHIYLFSLIFLSRIPLTCHVLSLIFLSPPMEFSCESINQNGEVEIILNHCPCKQPIWNRLVFKETMQTKFGIYCDNNWLTSFSESMFYAGLLFGALLFGFLSDKFGRLLSFSISCLITAVAGALVSVMPYISAFNVMRCIEGIGCGGAIITSYVLCIEYCGRSHRELITALFHVPINLGHATMAGLSYLIRDFDELQLAWSVPTVIMFFYYWLLVESPKWMLDKHNVNGAVHAMERICKFNNDSCDVVKADIETFTVSHNPVKAPTITCWQIFRYKQLTINLLCMSVIYFVCGMGYYGVSQFIGKMSGDIHLNVTISAFILLPGTIASIILMKVFGRRQLLMATYFLSGVFIFIVICIPLEMKWPRVILACLSNTFFFMSFIIVFLYGCELFPTAIRNSVLGYLSVLSRIGQIIAPPINATSQTTAGAVFGTMAILGGILCYPLPETKNKELPSYAHDMNEEDTENNVESSRV